MTLYAGYAWCQRSRSGGGNGLVKRAHVPLKPGGVVGHLDPDMARVYLCLALEGLCDLGLDLVDADRRHSGDVVRNAKDASHRADHPLNFVPLIVPLDPALEPDPAAFHPGMDLAAVKVGISFQDMGDRPGDIGAVPRLPGEPDFQFIGDCLDAVDPGGGPDPAPVLLEGRQ
jgi:hypothetical protein